MLSNELERGVDRLANKSVVVWEFSMRELSFGDWTPVAMHLGEPHESDFLNLQPGDSIVVSAYIAARSASPDPQEVTYSDHVITLHLTDICSEDHSVEQAQAVVYLLGMKDRRLTDAAFLRQGETIRIVLKSWSDYEAQMGGLNRNELDDVMLQLEVPVWGELCP